MPHVYTIKVGEKVVEVVGSSSETIFDKDFKMKCLRRAGVVITKTFNINKFDIEILNKRKINAL